MSLEHDTTMYEDAQARVLAQYRDLPQFLALVGELSGNVQTLEDAFWDLSNASLLDTAVGVWLEYLGTIVGEAAEGWADTDFRKFIKARIIANRSSGTIAEILTVLAFCLGLTTATTLESYTEYPPACAVAVVLPDVITTSALRARICRLLTRVRAAGVRLLVNTAFGSTVTFKMSDSDDAQPIIDANQGFDDSRVLGTTGGVFASGDLA